jgi:hypothetical protein
MELDRIADNCVDSHVLVDELLVCLTRLLELPKDIALAKPYTDELVAIFAQLTGVDARAEMLTRDDCYTTTGVAISPVQAAKCLQEPLRTQVFLKAVRQAIIDVHERIDVEPISILYAGTGPYGLLVLPLLALMKNLPIKVCLIDIHQQNIDSVTRLIELLDITDNIISIDCADACQWTPKSVKCFDLIVSETMTHLLQREPQVFIFTHLEQYLKAGGNLIPQEISLSAALVDNLKEVFLGEFFSLNQLTAKQLRLGDKQSYCGEVKIPQKNNLPTRLRLDTTLNIYKNFKLISSETSLAIPIYKDRLYFGERRSIPFYYAMTNNPHFVFDLPYYVPDFNLTKSDDLGTLGIPHLRRFWHKIQLDKAKHMDEKIRNKEFDLDATLVSNCGGSLQEWLNYLYQQHPPCFTRFEQWVQDNHDVHKVNNIKLKQ